jgi:hypothetical protein
MNDDGEMLVELWLALKPYIDKKERNDAALGFLRAAENYVDLEKAREDADGSDNSLDFAFDEVLGGIESDEEDIFGDEEDDY